MLESKLLCYGHSCHYCLKPSLIFSVLFFLQLLQALAEVDTRNVRLSRMWWLTPVTSALRRQSQQAQVLYQLGLHNELQASLGYVASSCVSKTK